MFPVETISAKALDDYVGRLDAVLIDLRSERDYTRVHVKTAVNIPYEQLDEAEGLPKEKILVLYCERGGASLKAAKQMAARGYRTKSVIGGITAYRGRNLVIS